MATDLARAYRACARTTRRHARNFYFAFLSLPRPERRAVYALYAFCRESDEIADCVADGAPAGLSATDENSSAALVSDEPEHASHCTDSQPVDLPVRRAKLAEMRERLAAAAAGRPMVPRDLALADTFERFGAREEDLADVLTGVEMDLEPTTIETAEELRTYCYHVASAVGLATLPILIGGRTPTDAMRGAAIDLGLGMQYVNILRDVAEDLGLGRIYLPLRELATHGAGESHLHARAMTDELRSFFTAHADRARDRLESGRRLLPLLPRRSRSCPWLLSEIYGRILARIVADDYPIFEQRVSLPTIEKLWLLCSSPWRRV